MDNRQAVLETVNKLFIKTDARRWEQVMEIFADSVLLDYTSMAGGEPATLTPEQIVAAWKGFLPGFEATHHQIGNYLIKVKDNHADVFCYGTATHYLPNESGKSVWIVVGSYDFHLTQSGGNWRVDRMKFNFKYQDGNTSLPAIAQKKVK